MKSLLVVLVIVIGLCREYSITRRFKVLCDDTEYVATESDRIEVPCRHSAGKSHLLKVAQARTHGFKGFGLRFDFDSAMAIQVEYLNAITLIKVSDGSGSFMAIQVFRETSDDLLSQVEKAIRSQVKALGGTAGETQVYERVIGPDKLKGFTFAATLAPLPVKHECFLKEAAESAYVFQFCTFGKQPSVDKAFTAIALSLRYDDDPK
jgi:hypothetical protein